MNYSEFEAIVSGARFEKYINSCSNRYIKARALYRANIRLSQKLYAIIGVFEIVLRNRIDRHFSDKIGPLWLEEAVDFPDGYLNRGGCENSLHSVHEAIMKLDTKYTHDGLIAALTFGFWTYQFSKKVYPASGNTLLQVFPQRQRGTNYKDMYDYLNKINILRNRVAHHEPICFDKTGTISTAMVTKRYDLIKDLISWMGYNPQKLFFGIDGVKKEIDAINKLREES